VPDVRAELIERAHRRYGIILPCGSKCRLRDCFTEERGLLLFWFNDLTGSTHMISIQKDSTCRGLAVLGKLRSGEAGQGRVGYGESRRGEDLRIGG
jgi:hypothetical protein